MDCTGWLFHCNISSSAAAQKSLGICMRDDKCQLNKQTEMPLDAPHNVYDVLACTQCKIYNPQKFNTSYIMK